MVISSPLSIFRFFLFTFCRVDIALHDTFSHVHCRRRCMFFVLATGDIFEFAISSSTAMAFTFFGSDFLSAAVTMCFLYRTTVNRIHPSNDFIHKWIKYFFRHRHSRILCDFKMQLLSDWICVFVVICVWVSVWKKSVWFPYFEKL